MQRTENRDRHAHSELVGPNTGVAILGIGLVSVAVAILWQGDTFSAIDWIGIARATGAFLFGAVVIAFLGFYEHHRAREFERRDESLRQLDAAAKRADESERRMHERKRRRNG